MKLIIKDLYNLILEVIIPFCKYLNSIKPLNEAKLKERRIFLTYLSINILKGKTLNSDTIKKIQKYLEINNENKEEIIKKYFQLLTNFFKNKYKNQSIKYKFEKEKNIMLKEIQGRINKDDDVFIELDDNFFDLDGEIIENINDMHYKDKDKISAKEFIKENILDIEIQEEINESINEIFYLLEKKEFDNDYLKCLIFILNSFISVFNLFHEFRNLSYALVELKQIILNMDIISNNKIDTKLLKLLLDSILEDLKNWVDNVIIEQTAIDIHYLDASLLANIKQISNILNINKI